MGKGKGKGTEPVFFPEPVVPRGSVTLPHVQAWPLLGTSVGLPCLALFPNCLQVRWMTLAEWLTPDSLGFLPVPRPGRVLCTLGQEDTAVMFARCSNKTLEPHTSFGSWDVRKTSS